MWVQLIIFPGKNLQSTWKGDKALPNTFYGISDSGWMTTEVFATWLHQICGTCQGTAITPDMLMATLHISTLLGDSRMQSLRTKPNTGEKKI